jgi:cytochrome P450
MDADASSTDANASRTDEPESGKVKYSRTLADLPGPRPLPVIGNLLQLSHRQLHLTIEKWIREFGPVFRFTVLGTSVLVVSDHNVVNNVLRKRPDVFRRNTTVVDIMKELKINGLFGAEGDPWRRQRKLFMRGLSPDVVRNYFPKMVHKTERLLHRWKTALEGGRQVDLHRDLKAVALDTIVGVAMGYDIDALNNDGNQLQRDIDNIFQTLGRRNAALFAYWRHFRLPADRAADRSAAGVEAKVAQFIKDTRERMRQQPELHSRPSNMLEAMIAASEEPDSGFTDQELIGNAISSVVGGEDTTAQSIAWMVNLLAQHPAAAARLAAEADAVLGDAPLLTQWEKLNHLPYLEATHNESQRLRAVSPAISVISNVECVVAETLIPKNTPIVASTNGASLDEAHFPQTGLFRPERWIFEQRPAENADPMRKLFPFGAGRRLCPGRFLALTEIKMVVSMLMRNFELEFDTAAPPIKQLMNFFMVPSAVPVRLKLRNH